MPDKIASRRRGQALEEALLEAAWEQLIEAGPVGFTFDAIAQRASTSKAVLYRRWSNVEALWTASLAWHRRQDPLPAPDTGNFREDLLELFRAANQKPERYLIFFKTLGSGWLEQAGMTPAELRDKYLSGSTLGIDTVFDRAVARGEIGNGVLTPILRALPFDLFRSRMLLTLAPLPDTELMALVDEVIVPLVTRTRIQSGQRSKR